jgi:3-hydroxypropanoate dehydrogenase
MYPGPVHPSPYPLPVRGEGINCTRDHYIYEYRRREFPLPSRGEGRVRGERGARAGERRKTKPAAGRTEIEMLTNSLRHLRKTLAIHFRATGRHPGQARKSNARPCEQPTLAILSADAAPIQRRQNDGTFMAQTHSISEPALEQIFTKARTHSGWLPEPVSDQLVRQLYELMKWGPTSANCCPARILFIRSKEAKEKLLPCMAPGNVDKTRSAPVTAVIAMDMEFYEKLPTLFPFADARSWFAGNPALIESTAFRNGSLQGAYFIIAARSLGLDCGPMSGFDNAKVDAAFFQGTSWKSNFVCNLGHGDPTMIHPRAPRLKFEEACRIV